MSSDQPTQLPVTFEDGDAIDIALKSRYRRAMGRARAMEQLGKKIMRVKMKAMAAMGKHAEELGIKHIGHGKMLVASETSEEAIAKIDELIEQHGDSEETVVQLMEIRLGYARLLMETGKAHIDAEKQVSALNKTANITIPFPAGNPMVVAVKQVEDVKPTE